MSASTERPAIFISLVALSASMYLGYKAYEHNQLSVSPYLDISYVFNQDGNSVPTLTTIRVDNPGLEPAIIMTYDIVWKAGTEEEVLSTWNDLRRGHGGWLDCDDWF